MDVGSAVGVVLDEVGDLRPPLAGGDRPRRSGHRAQRLGRRRLTSIIGVVDYEMVLVKLRAPGLPAINAPASSGITLGGLLGGWLAAAGLITPLSSGVRPCDVTLTPFVFSA